MFGFIGDIFSWLWDTIISVIIGFIKLEIKGLGIIFQWLYDNIVKPVFDAIGKIFNWLWDNVAKPVFGFLKDAWDGLGTAIGWVWDHVLKPVFDTFGTVVSGLQSIFETVVGAIGTAWDGLKSIAATPINFVIETVLNNGLIKAFNAVVGFFGLDSWKITPLTPVSFAKGGVVQGYSPTDTADNIPAYLTAKEYVQPRGAVRKYGIDFMDAVRTGRFPVELSASVRRRIRGRWHGRYAREDRQGEVPSCDAEQRTPQFV